MWGSGIAKSIARPSVHIGSSLTHILHFIDLAVFELLSWLQKHFRPPVRPSVRPSDSDTISIAAVEANASSSGN